MAEDNEHEDAHLDVVGVLHHGWVVRLVWVADSVGLGTLTSRVFPVDCVADSGDAVLVAQGHVRGRSRPPSALLGYQPVSVFAVVGAVVVLCFHLCC